MKIAVTSENKLKLEAVRTAYANRGISIDVVGYSTESGVGEQPVDEQTLTGARNRISDLLKKVNGFDKVISIENGIFDEHGEWVDRAVVVVYDSGKESVEYSKGVVFPRQFVEKARQIGFDTTTVGQVMADAGYISDAKDPHDSIAGKPRRDYIIETIEKAIGGRK